MREASSAPRTAPLVHEGRWKEASQSIKRLLFDSTHSICHNMLLPSGRRLLHCCVYFYSHSLNYKLNRACKQYMLRSFLGKIPVWPRIFSMCVPLRVHILNTTSMTVYNEEKRLSSLTLKCYYYGSVTEAAGFLSCFSHSFLATVQVLNIVIKWVWKKWNAKSVNENYPGGLTSVWNHRKNTLKWLHVLDFPSLLRHIE